MAVHKYNKHQLAWKVCTRKQGVTVIKTPVPGSEWDLVCGDTTIEDATVPQLLAFLADDEKRKKYDRMFAGAVKYTTLGEDLEQGNSFSNLARYHDEARYDRAPTVESGVGMTQPPEGGQDIKVGVSALKEIGYRGVWPVSDRRFEVLTSSGRFKHPDDHRAGALLATRSVQTVFFPDGPLPPLSSSTKTKKTSPPQAVAARTVCAKILIAGFRVRPLPLRGPSYKPRCRLTMISHIDFGGNMPSQLINYVQTTVMPEMLGTEPSES